MGGWGAEGGAHLNSSDVTPPLKLELNQRSIFFTSGSSTIPFTLITVIKYHKKQMQIFHLLTMATQSSMVIPALASCLAVTGPSAAEDPHPILLLLWFRSAYCFWC